MRAIELGSAGDLTFLVTQYGKPFTAKDFGNSSRGSAPPKRGCHDVTLPCVSSYNSFQNWVGYGRQNPLSQPQGRYHRGFDAMRSPRPNHFLRGVGATGRRASARPLEASA